jgi:acyl carrier protein
MICSLTSARLMDERFIAIVRRHLPLLAPSEELVPDTPFWEFGLDSMATVGLVIELETELGVRLPESALTPSTFMNAATLWNAISASMRS